MALSRHRIARIAAPSAAMRPETSSPRESRWRRWLRLSAGLATAAAALGVGLGLLGWAWFDLDFFAHFRGHFGLLALLGAALAIGANAWRRTAAALGVAMVAAAALWPVWRAAPAAGEAPCGVERLRVVTANLYAGNRAPARAAAALLALQPDILVTQETTAAFWRSSGLLRLRLPHVIARRAGGAYGVVLFSRLSIRDGAAGGRDAGAPGRAFGAIDIAGREFGVVGLHVSWPLLGPQREQIEGLERIMASLPPERILLGDFNAAPWSEALRRIERASGALVTPGLRKTWRGGYPNPFGERSLRAPLGHQLDHILIPPGVGVARVWTAKTPGSDHRAVAADLTIPRVCPGA